MNELITDSWGNQIIQGNADAMKLLDELLAAGNGWLTRRYAGGQNVSTADIVWKRNHIGQIEIAKRQGLNAMTFFFIRRAFRGLGFAKAVLQELTRNRFYFILNCQPLEIKWNTTFNDQYVPVDDLDLLYHPDALVIQSPCKEKKLALREMYRRCGLNDCKIAGIGPEYTMMTNYPDDLPGTLTILKDTAHDKRKKR
jgi:hypothetical protein